MSASTYNILFLCTGNSARSILAEVIMNARAEGRFKAFSAGSHPAGRVNPFAVALLQSLNLPTDDLRSKSWDEFARPDAPPMDFIITVCDNAAGETCPIWPGQPTSAHWGFSDPAAVTGDDAQKRQSFHEVFLQIEAAINRFLALPVEHMDREMVQQSMRAIGADLKAQL